MRGVVATDALIGTFASMNDPSLIQNRCFLYHLIGNGTGEWRVPVGGMGAVTDALAACAVTAGAEVVTSAEVTAVRGGRGAAEVDVARGGQVRTVRARVVLACVAPWTLSGLLGAERDPAAKPVGAQLKVNFLLRRLPRLASGADPRVAFAGTLHLGEDYPELERAYAEAAAGQVPSKMPGEVYCHSLTDPSILGPVPDGTQTLTYFGLHLPATLFADPATRAQRKELAVQRAIASLDEHLARPDRVGRRAGRGRQALHRGEDPARHRGGPGRGVSASPLRCCWLPSPSPAVPAFAVNKDMVQLQTQIQDLQEAVTKLQQSNDERMGVMKDLVQQSADSINKMATNLDAIQRQWHTQQEAQGTKIDQVSSQIQSLNDSLDELKARLGRLEKLTQAVQNQQQSMSANMPHTSAGAC